MGTQIVTKAVVMTKLVLEAMLRLPQAECDTKEAEKQMSPGDIFPPEYPTGPLHCPQQRCTLGDSPHDLRLSTQDALHKLKDDWHTKL